MTIAYDDMIAKLAFGQPDRLGKALEVSGVSSNEMAKYLGVSRTTISNYINGRTPAKRQTLVSWALRTGVPIAWLEDGTESALRPDGGGNSAVTGLYQRNRKSHNGGVILRLSTPTLGDTRPNEEAA